MVDDVIGPISTTVLKLDESAQTVFAEQVRDAASWCAISAYPDDRARTLRSSELRPPRISDVVAHVRESTVLVDCMQHVVTMRSQLLSERGIDRRTLDHALRTGRLIGHDHMVCLDEQIPASTSLLFDEVDLIGWDAWVYLIPGPESMENGTLVAYVPDWLAGEVDRAMITTSDCLAWILPGLVWPTRYGPRSDEPR